MRHSHLDQLKRKQVTGKQQILPALRDAVEDSRAVFVTIDTEAGRYSGEATDITARGSSEYVYVKRGADVVPRGLANRKVSVATHRIIALRIDSIEETDASTVEALELAGNRGDA